MSEDKILQGDIGTVAYLYAKKESAKRINELEALVDNLTEQRGLYKELAVKSVERIAELEAACDVALEALEKHSTSLLNHEDEYAEAIAKLNEARRD